MTISPTEEGSGVLLEAEDLRERGLGASFPPGPLVLEIGFGRAEELIEMARKAPGCGILGVEVSRKRAQKAARRIGLANVPNVRLVHGTAEYLLFRVLPEETIAACWINFPDPWPKSRHHKRRLIRPDVTGELVRVLEPDAILHIATDHPGYAEWIACVLDRVADLENLHAPDRWGSVRPDRAETRYEAEFLAEGRTIAYFDYRRRRAEETPAGPRPSTV